jgi:predicted metal-dependent phosphoesterase TrpH
MKPLAQHQALLELIEKQIRIMKADLHVHSTASDGRFSPRELVKMAADAGLKALGITDHDSVNGIADAIDEGKKYPSLIVIPGVELSTDVPQGEIHVLGYFVKYNDEVFEKTLNKLRNGRLIRAQNMLSKLADLGIHVNWGRVKELAGDASIGRPHIAQAMLEQDFVYSFKDAFNRYIGRNGPAYVEREKMTPSQAVKEIANTNGLPVLAHPADIDNLESLIVELQKSGLIGIEVYYSGYTTNRIDYLASLAKKYNLIACGGSDYHGLQDNMEIPLGGIDIPSECIEQLLNAARQKSSAI